MNFNIVAMKTQEHTSNYCC